MLIAYHPSNSCWGHALDEVQHGASFAQRLLLDIYRLRRAVGILTKADEYATMAELAVEAGYPGEARRVLREGSIRGVLGDGLLDGVEQLRIRDIASERATDEQHVRESASDSDGNVLACLGFALALDEQTERSIALLEMAMAKSELEMPDDVRFRLGLAQLWAGHRSTAERTMRGIRSNDGTQELVPLWLSIADNVKNSVYFTRTPSSSETRAGRAPPKRSFGSSRSPWNPPPTSIGDIGSFRIDLPERLISVPEQATLDLGIAPPTS